MNCILEGFVRDSIFLARCLLRLWSSVLWLNYFNPEDRGNMYLRKLVSDTTTLCHCPGGYRRNIPYSSEVLGRFFTVQKKIMLSTNKNERVFIYIFDYLQYRRRWYNHVSGLINMQNYELCPLNINRTFPGWSISQYYCLSDLKPIDKKAIYFFYLQTFSKYLVVPTRSL